MSKSCPYCELSVFPSEIRPMSQKVGKYRRKSDCKWIQKYRCVRCKKYFSAMTTHACRYQKKRQFNHPVFLELASQVSIRRTARKLKLSRTTVARKLIFLGRDAKAKLSVLNLESPRASIIEFDDMETFEHTKCKPLSVTLAVEHKTRRILGFRVSKMPAKGRLAKIAFKKYGKRKDERAKGRKELFSELQDLIDPEALIKSDQNPHYAPDVKVYFPKATYTQFKGQRGSVTGQGELKKIRFDPLFSLNHTCAMYRANVNRLARKTWCTTKLPQRLEDHLAIYALYHNLSLKDST